MQIKDVSRFIAEVRRLDSEMPLQQIHCLLILATDDEGMSLTELSRRAEINLATASRYIAALGKINRHREEGLQLIEAFEDPMERRKKIIRLTGLGKAFISRALGGKRNDDLHAG